MEDVWHELTNFESRDLVFESYRKRHGREPNAARINEITAAFIQGREYYESAKAAAITVRPLLQYYGVTSLAKGLILMLQSARGAEALKPSHGLSVGNWKEVLSRGLDHIGELSVTICQGTFHELVEALGNKAYFRHGSSGLDFGVNFPQPPLGGTFSLLDVAEAMPDAAEDYATWTGNPHPSIQIESWEADRERGVLKLHLERHRVVNQPAWFEEQLRGIGTLHLGPVELVGEFPLTPGPLFGERNGTVLGIGEFCVVKPLSGNYIASMGVYFAASYFLGMLV